MWSAMGTVLVTTMGVLLFGETFDVSKLICLAMIVAGVVGLNLRG
jgi:small multidrug resistance pump